MASTTAATTAAAAATTTTTTTSSSPPAPSPLPPPFIEIEGLQNVRPIGPTYPHSPSIHIRPGIVYRGSEPARITPLGKAQFHALGIKTVVDLRNDTEPDAVLAIEGVEWIRPEGEGRAPVDFEKTVQRMKKYETDVVKAFVEAYEGILDNAGSVFELLFTFLRDYPLKPVLIQCSAGKNRTGVATALLLSILGVSDRDIIDDYALSAVGLELGIPALIAKFEGRSPAYKNNPVGLRNFLSAKAETMEATLALVREKFGNAENYLVTHTALTQADIEKIRSNLLVR